MLVNLHSTLALLLWEDEVKDVHSVGLVSFHASTAVRPNTEKVGQCHLAGRALPIRPRTRLKCKWAPTEACSQSAVTGPSHGPRERWGRQPPEPRAYVTRRESERHVQMCTERQRQRMTVLPLLFWVISSMSHHVNSGKMEVNRAGASQCLDYSADSCEATECLHPQPCAADCKDCSWSRCQMIQLRLKSDSKSSKNTPNPIHFTPNLTKTTILRKK